MVHPLFDSAANAGGGSYAGKDETTEDKMREEDLAKATKRLAALEEKLAKLESKMRKPKTYEEDKAKLEKAIVKVKAKVQKYQPVKKSAFKGLSIADAGAIANSIDKEMQEREKQKAGLQGVLNQEIIRIMDPEAERRAAEKREALEQQVGPAPPKPPPSTPGPCSQCDDAQKGIFWCEVCGVLLCDWHRQNHERTKHSAGHCIRKIGASREEDIAAKQQARARGKKKKAHYPQVGPNLDDDERWPNKAYNGELPYPIPPRTKKYAGEYEGDFDDRGVRHGSGKVVFPNGDVYTGKFKNGMRQGFGTYVLNINTGKGESKPQRYEGRWQQSARQGEGKEVWPDGSYYEGSWVKDKFHGQGTYYNRNAKYIGEFEEGLKRGKGKIEYLGTNDTYEGEWLSNRFHGKGTYIWGSDRMKFQEPSKKYNVWDHNFTDDRYTGEWFRGMRSGRGVYTKLTGEQWDGEWKNGYRHGMGTIRYRTGKKRDGVWRHDSMIVWNTPEYFGAPPSNAVGNRQGADVGKAVGSMVLERAINAEPGSEVKAPRSKQMFIPAARP